MVTELTRTIPGITPPLPDTWKPGSVGNGFGDVDPTGPGTNASVPEAATTDIVDVATPPAAPLVVNSAWPDRELLIRSVPTWKVLGGLVTCAVKSAIDWRRSPRPAIPTSRIAKSSALIGLDHPVTLPPIACRRRRHAALRAV
jgi:hypothetical protein